MAMNDRRIRLSVHTVRRHDESHCKRTDSNSFSRLAAKFPPEYLLSRNDDFSKPSLCYSTPMLRIIIAFSSSSCMEQCITLINGPTYTPTLRQRHCTVSVSPAPAPTQPCPPNLPLRFVCHSLTLSVGVCNGSHPVIVALCTIEARGAESR